MKQRGKRCLEYRIHQQGKFNVCYDLYKTRHCTSSGSGQSIHAESWWRTLKNCKEDSEIHQRNSNVALCYRGSKFTVRGYVDSDFAGDLDKRKSNTSYVFTLARWAVSWVSKLQTVVALSTTKAEYMVAAQACKESIWIQRLLEEFGHK